MNEDWQRTGIGLPHPRRDRVADTYMSADEMDARMTVLVDQFDSADDEMRKCPKCGAVALIFGALWSNGWHAIQACTSCERLVLPVVTPELEREAKEIREGRLRW